MTVGRSALIFGAVAIVVVVVIAILEEFGVGYSELGPEPEELTERIIYWAEVHEEGYLLYGRWIDLLVGLAFLGLLVAAPFLERVGRARHLLVAGAAIAVVGDAIDLSQLVGIDVARWALENNLMADFTAGNTFRWAINTTSTYVWVTGLLILAVGMLILTKDSKGKLWRTITGVFAVSLAATALTDVSGNSVLFELTQYAMAAVGLTWMIIATKHLNETQQTGEA